MANLKKGFIKISNGDIILPISRGELIFDTDIYDKFRETLLELLN